ncbi:hypothetical protein QSH66_26125, partial [Escherichia coli]
IDYSKHLVNFLNNHGYRTVLSGIQHEAGWYLDHESGAKMIGYKENLTCDNSNYRQEDLTIWDSKNAHEVTKWLDNYDKKEPFFLSYGM